MTQNTNKNKIGLILSGGGARAAYQVGVLRAIAELIPRETPNPFPIICGTSAGAINTAALAVYGKRFGDAVGRMLRIWRNFHVQQVFRTDFPGMLKNGIHWMLAIFLGGLSKRNPVSLLDRAPLEVLLNKYLSCDQIQQSIDDGILESICITASSYWSGKSVIFYQSSQPVKPWHRARRYGKPEEITRAHLMASSAIPVIFSAVRVGNEYFGDGSMRQTAPISPAIHMGADKVLVIGVSQQPGISVNNIDEPEYPSLGVIGSHILNSIFIDSMEADLERLNRINKTIGLIPSQHLEEGEMMLRPVDVLVVEPSEDIQKISNKHVMSLPWTLRFLLKGIGALDKNGSSIVSYILFEKAFCRELISLGYNDAMKRKEEIIEFLGMDIRME